MAAELLAFGGPPATGQQAPHRHIGKHAVSAREARSHTHHQRAPVLDVREFMGDHPRDLIPAEQPRQALRHGHDSVLRVAAGGKSVGRVFRFR